MPAISFLIMAATGLAPVAAPAAQTEGITPYVSAYFANTSVVTALDMVERLPGFRLDNGNSVRGLEGAGGNVLIDGSRPVSKSEPVQEVLRRIPAGQVERIDLIRGGAPGIDMQGKASVINIVRTRGARWQGAATVGDTYAIDRRNFGETQIEASGDLAGGKFEGSANYGGGFDDRDGNGSRVRTGPDGLVSRRADLDSHGDGYGWRLSGTYTRSLLGGTLKANGHLGGDNFSHNEVRRFVAPATSVDTGGDSFDFLSPEAELDFKRPLSGTTDLNLVFLTKRFDMGIVSIYRPPGQVSRFSLDKNTAETVVRTVLTRRQGANLSFEAGAEMALNTLESATSYLDNGKVIDLPSANVEVREVRSQAFGKAIWRPVPKWTVEAGLGYEVSTLTATRDVQLDKILNFAKPRLFVTWQASPTTQLRARAERTVGQLDFDDFVAGASLGSDVVTSGNPDLNPEAAWEGELAFEQGFWTNSGSVSLSLSHSRISNAIDRAPVYAANGDIFDAPANIGKGRRTTLSSELTLPLDRLGVRRGLLRGSAAWHWSDVTDPTTGQNREISGVRPLVWEVHFTQDLPAQMGKWGSDIYGAWSQTAYRFDQIATDKLGTTVSLYTEYKLRPDLTLRAGIGNTTNRSYHRGLQVYDGPRNTGALAYQDDQVQRLGRYVRVRIRKTFG